jgi:hypothetical protein
MNTELKYAFILNRRPVSIKGEVRDKSTDAKIRLELWVEEEHLGTFEKNPSRSHDLGKTVWEKKRGIRKSLGRGNLLSGVLLLKGLLPR